MFAAGLAACGSRGRPSSPPAKDSAAAPARTAPIVMFVGTSLTAGYGLDPSVAWPALVQRMIDSAGLAFHVVNAGVSGETSADARHRMGWLLSQGVPAAIVIETGANDALRGQPVDSIRSNLRAILAGLDTLRPRPVIVVAGMEALPNLGREYGRQFSALFPEVTQEFHAHYLPFLLAGVAGIDSLNQADGLHPTASGSRRVAANVWRTLGPILDSLARSHHGGL